MMRNNQEDFFDRLFSLSFLRPVAPFCRAHKEILLYLLFGGLAFVVSIGSYLFFELICKLDPLIANIFSFILAVLFSFFTNRIWVFSAKTNTAKEFFSQFFSFFGGRIATGLLEEGLLAVFVTLLGFPGWLIKILAQILVIILNYIISKLLVFRSSRKNQTSEREDCTHG